MQATASTQSLGQIVEHYRHFIVEEYQRTYSWEESEVEDFFEDLKECVTTGDQHFFGTLILHTRSGELPKEGTARIVDGQQRLTTTMLFVAAARDELINLPNDVIRAPGHKDKKVKDICEDFLLPGTDLKVYRYQPISVLQDLYANCVMETNLKLRRKVPSSGNPLTKRFRRAITKIRALLADDLAKVLGDDEKLLRLDALLDALLNRFMVLQVSTSSLSESLDIFLTLNNRGTPLGAGDLIRGEIMNHLAYGESEESKRSRFLQVSKEWEELSANVSDTETFLRHHLVASHREPVQKTKIFDLMTNRFLGQNQAQKKVEAEQLWTELKISAQNYAKLINPDPKAEYFYHLTMLNGLAKSPRVLGVSVMSQAMSESHRKEAFRLIFVLAFKWFVAKKNAQDLEKKFQKLSCDLRESQNVSQLLSDLKREASFDLDPRMFFQDEPDKDFTGKAILHVIDRACYPHANVIALDSSVHLEHIAPQTMTSAWEIDLLGREQIDEDEYSSKVRQIGNLALLDGPLNKGLGQRSFAEKKNSPERGYKLGGFNQTCELVKVKNWSVIELDLRTEWLSESFNLAFNPEPLDAPLADWPTWLRAKGRGDLLA